MRNELFLVASSEMHIPRSRNQHDLLRKLTLIFREDGSATNQAMNQFLEGNNIRVFRKLQLTSNEAVKQALIAGLGYSIMPLIGIRNELQLGQLTIIQLPDLPLESMWRVVWPKGKKHSGVAQAFKTYLEQNMAQIVEQNFGFIDGLAAVPKSIK